MTRASRQWPLTWDEFPVDEKHPETNVVYECNDNAVSLVVGTCKLYDNGMRRVVPMPTPDPKDPLNWPNRQKWIAIAVIAFFGSLSLSAELVIGGLIPVFLLEYSGVNPRALNDVDFQTQSRGDMWNIDPLSGIPPGVIPASLDRVALINTVPLVANGVASYILVPLSIAVGRRPVILLAATCVWVGAIWAGLSNSLVHHYVARGLQGFGAGAIEALIPLIVQDLTFIHERNHAMASVISSRGLFMVALGIASPYIAVNYTWRWLYFITAGLGFLAWILLIGFLPETRWNRCDEELSGQNVWPMRYGHDRPQLDYVTFSPPTFWSQYGLFQEEFEFRNAVGAVVETLRTTFFPAVLWTVLVNSIFLICTQVMGQLTTFALLAQGWQFEYAGLSTIPFFVASLFSYIFGGPVADILANAVTRWNRGTREPEHHLVNLILPLAAGVGGCFLFGYVSEKNSHWALLLTAAALVVFGFLSAMSVINVFVVESYPSLAGAVLVNVSSVRSVITFFVARHTIEWVKKHGPQAVFAIYAEAMIVLCLGVPVLYFFGKRLREFTAGIVHGVRVEKWLVDSKQPS